MFLEYYPIIQVLILSTSNQLPYCPIVSKLSVLKLPHYLIDENVTGVLPHYAIICKFITTTCSLFVVVHLSGLFGEKETRRLYDQIQRKQLENKGQCKVEMVIANQVDQKDAVQAIFKVTVSGSQDRARRSSSPSWPSRRRSTWPSRRRSTWPSRRRSTWPSRRRSTWPSRRRSTWPSRRRSTWPSRRRSTWPSRRRSTWPSRRRSTWPSRRRSTWPSRRRSTWPSRRRSTWPSRRRSTWPSRRRSTWPSRRRSTWPSRRRSSLPQPL